MAQLELRESWALPLTEVSALSVRPPPSGDLELIAVSDEQFDVLGVPIDAAGDLGEVDVHDLALKLSVEVLAASDGSEFEGVACDGSGRVFILQEGPARVLVVAPDWSGLERIVNLHVEPDEPGFGAEWNGTDKDARNRRGEGLLLLGNGHMLVVKQRNPVRFIEFGPPGNSARGLSADTYLAPGAAFEAAEPGDLDYGVLASWPLSDNERSAHFPALNDVALAEGGRLYVLSSKSRRIARLEEEVGPGEAAVKLTDDWELPAELPGGEDGKPEGLVLVDGRSALVSIDTKMPDDNLVRLEGL